ncbi:unnamed protein product [Rotaria magnacalcarata]|uniref:UDP-N-acetylglucosamine--dolichyl-phosphate N-acetylglucosaminephosphotransferase n=2 Tax=Rotaria magnacalcarata TaxID=392030 RepID=A0A816CQZ7_9BILA|nr:unnamed protein product [Rotaria magnacalcarata]CAF2108257.1 unnamed protein product [Rotaria magnacalcarata]CAF3984558.1 unnamed protein product [Rotaria magnacalcarata]CAF4191868.1 unnamed protein product [Rotaria magnacalcarata]
MKPTQMSTSAIDRFDFFTIAFDILTSIVGSIIVNQLIPILKEKFIKAQLYGHDLNKRNSTEVKIAESQGVLAAGIFLVLMFIMIAVVFSEHLHPASVFPHKKFVEYLAALLSICCMVLLGFADDVLDLRWSVKLLLPLVVSLPLLLVYFANYHSTTIILPKPVRPYLGQQWNLGILYYVYMSMVAVFCTNAINILAGVNGLEVGQSIVIAISILIFNLVELQGVCWEEHLFSLYFMIPFVACTFPILIKNWCPAEIFVGNTLCYFAGMTFAVVGIIGHFSKTMLLFFIPQIINFLLSVPQLFHFIPCPRHRLPRLDPELNKLNPSEVEFKKSDLKLLGWLMLRFFSMTKFIRYREYTNNDGERLISTTNFTIINTVLCWFGPLHEETLSRIIILIQIVLGSLLTFFIRYYLVKCFYDS